LARDLDDESIKGAPHSGHGQGQQGAKSPRYKRAVRHLLECQLLAMMIQVMKTLTYTSVRSKFAKVMDEVNDDAAPVLVTRKNARSVVIIGQDEYESMAETLYLMSSARNAQELNEAIAEINAGKTVQFDWEAAGEVKPKLKSKRKANHKTEPEGEAA
jgi:antitoxin YefM